MPEQQRRRRRTGDRHRGVRRQIWAPKEEAERWDQAAELAGISVSAWLRRAANQAYDAMQEKVRGAT